MNQNTVRAIGLAVAMLILAAAIVFVQYSLRPKERFEIQQVEQCQCGCAGDVNRDGKVDDEDMVLLKENLRRRYANGEDVVWDMVRGTYSYGDTGCPPDIMDSPPRKIYFPLLYKRSR